MSLSSKTDANKGKSLLSIDGEFYVIHGFSYSVTRERASNGKPTSHPTLSISPFTIEEPRSDGGKGESKLLAKSTVNDSKGFDAEIEIPNQNEHGAPIKIILKDVYFNYYSEFDDGNSASVTLMPGYIEIAGKAKYKETWSDKQ